eukprot:SAG31_NODE_6417_length_2027_cov_19.380705_1_plen_196_part_00
MPLGNVVKVGRCLAGHEAGVGLGGGGKIEEIDETADVAVVQSLIAGVQAESLLVCYVRSKRSAGATWQVGRCLAGCEAGVGLGGGGKIEDIDETADVAVVRSSRADLGVVGSRTAAIQIDWQMTCLGRSKRIASGTLKVDECQPGHGVPDGVDDDDVEEWCEVAVIAAVHAKQNMPAPQNETGIRAVCLQRSTEI